MDNSLLIVDSILEARRNELIKLDADEAAEAEEWAANHEPGLRLSEASSDSDNESYYESLEDDDPDLRRYRIRAEMAVLEQVKEMLTKQHAENTAHFMAIKQRDDSSSRQNLWLTISTSFISIIVGWLLSLLSSPVSVLHALGR